MKHLAWGRPNKDNSLFCNVHFWAIVVIALALTFLYYLDILFIDFNNPSWHWLWRIRIFEYRNDINGALFCIPFVYAALIFWWRGILATWLYSVVVMVPVIRFYTGDALSIVVNLIYLLVPLLVVLIIALQRTRREIERQALAERDEQRQACIAQVFAAQEDERKRISREIHDDTTQRLWGLANRTQMLLNEKAEGFDSGTVAELGAIKDSILNISDDARRLSVALRPGILDDLGLVPAIRSLIDQLNVNGKTTARLQVVNAERPLGNDASNHLFRIIQEALNNVRRHSEATQVLVTLEFDADTVKMTIEDNGKGFSFRANDKRYRQGELGILGIQERVRLLDGTVEISSRASSGTVLSLEFAA